MPPRSTPLVLVSGFHRSQTSLAAGQLLASAVGTVVVHHDLSSLGQGVVVRSVTTSLGGRPGSAPWVRTAVHQTPLELTHGCVSCTLRQDVLPLLRELARRPDVARVVLQLDPALEPEAVCDAIWSTVLEDGGTAGDEVTVEAVVTVLDAGTWLEDVTGEATLADRGLAVTDDDDRTLAQVVLGQTGAADVVLLAGPAVDDWTGAQLSAALARWVPSARCTSLQEWDPARLLTGLGPHARRGRARDPHAPLLDGQPPLDADAGIELLHFSARRPFHPLRLHEALDLVLDGVVGSRGRLWLATEHGSALWLESAGGALEIGDAGPWLAALGDDADAWAQVDAERRVAAALRWHPLHGDRDVEIVVLLHRQSPELVSAALSEALLTDEELALGPVGWTFDDPFGTSHEDPCGSSPSSADARAARSAAAAPDPEENP